MVPWRVLSNIPHLFRVECVFWLEMACGRPYRLFQAKARWSPKVQNSEMLHHMGATRPFHAIPGRPNAGQGWSNHLLDVPYPVGQPFCRGAPTRRGERSLQKHRDFQY
eukprot:COSAG02_NODE_5277_length_4477_cov_15.451348_4_plen_108_part_00